jgi:hypothetical protein
MQNRRGKKFIDRQVQGGLVIKIAAHWLLYFMLVLFSIPMWHMITVSGFSKSFPLVLADSWSQMTPVFLFLAAVLPIFIWETIKLSHRFVGPMYRLHSTIRSINAGEEFRPIHFRDDDFWQEVADDFNTMMVRLMEQQGAESVCEQEPVRDEELVPVSGG